MSMDQMRNNRIYTRHGEKHMQGVVFRTRDGKSALGFQNGDVIVGYTTAAELTERLSRADLPIMDVDVDRDSDKHK